MRSSRLSDAAAFELGGGAKFSPELLDRLATWQQEFDAHYHWDRGWESDQIRDRWASQAEDLAADVQAELGTRARLDVKPWGLGS